MVCLICLGQRLPMVGLIKVSDSLFFGNDPENGPFQLLLASQVLLEDHLHDSGCTGCY